MILVVASAVALAITRQVDSSRALQPRSGSLGLDVGYFLERWVSPWLVSLSLAFWPIRLRSPRPPLGRLLRRPGALAACSGLLALAFTGLLALTRFLAVSVFHRTSPIRIQRGLFDFLGNVIAFGGTFILGVWFALALVGRFRRGPGWIERFGVAVGAAWVASDLVRWFSFQVLL